MTSFILRLSSVAAILASVPIGCSSTTDNCANTSSCVPPSAGASGSAEAGASGMNDSAGEGGAGAGGGVSGSDGGESGESGTAGMSGDSGAGPGETPCDPSKSPSEESCLVSNEYAIFVAPTGKDGADGSQAAPVKTLAKALELAADSKIVIACDASYDERLTLTASARLYGGFGCPGRASPWEYEAGKKAKVAPSNRGLALKITAGDAAVVIEDFEFDAKDGVEPGESSIAAFVNASTNVTLRRVKLVAGTAVDGENGTLVPWTFPDPLSLKGNSANGDSGGGANTGMCPVGPKPRGGAGGNGGEGAVTTGGSGTPDLALGKGGVAGSCSTSGTGQDGANASPQPAAAGATKLGTITLTGWNGSAGADGASGTPGQGGGGGAGALTGGGGGAGGSGGCGGAGATGGKAGGSSISLLVLSSSLALDANELVAGNAGKGGSGLPGQAGQPGGSGGVQVPDGCPGGKGGQGGQGGAGGGAAGGISVGIAYQGALPVVDLETTFATGLAGAKGIGGVSGTNDGIAGVKQDVFQVP